MRGDRLIWCCLIQFQLYITIHIHEQPRKVNDFKNIKSLHFDPNKLEPLKIKLFRSAIELEINVYVAVSTLLYF